MLANIVSAFGRRRLALIAIVLVYTAVFNWSYVNIISPLFSYLLLTYRPPSTGSLLIAWTLAMVPSLWMPVSLKRPSQMIYWVLYFTIIIPSMFVTLYTLDVPDNEVLLLDFVLFASYGLLGTVYLLPRIRIPHVRPSPIIFWGAIIVMSIVFNGYILAVFGTNLHLVRLEDVYGLRATARETAESTYVNYATLGQSNAINPLLMALGVFHRRPLLFLLGAAGQVLIYATGGAKYLVFSILFVPAMSLAMGKEGRSYGRNVSLAVTSIFVIGIVLHAVEMKAVEFVVTGVLLTRTFTIPSLFTAQYYNFFSSHPWTLMSHVKGFNLFHDYPYHLPLANLMGDYYYNQPYVTGNAHMWATDGLAAFGLWGVPIVSLLCIPVFLAMDSAALGMNPRLPSLICIIHAFNLSSNSLFSSLLGGGLSLSILFVYFLPERLFETAPKPESARKRRWPRLVLKRTSGPEVT